MGGEGTRPFLGKTCQIQEKTHRGDPYDLKKFWKFFGKNKQFPMILGVSGVISQILSQIGQKNYFSPKNGRVPSPPIPMI